MKRHCMERDEHFGMDHVLTARTLFGTTMAFHIIFNTFRALFVTYIVDFAILFPGFIYFWRLFMKDRRYLENDEK